MRNENETIYNVAVHYVIQQQKPTNEYLIGEKLNIPTQKAQNILIRMQKEGIVGEETQKHRHVLLERPYFNLTKKEEKLFHSIQSIQSVQSEKNQEEKMNQLA